MIELSEKKIIGPIIRLHPADNVVVARVDIQIGTKVESEGFTSKSQVVAGHKLAARDIKAGEPILKYNVCIGFAASDIPVGTYVHSHNVTFREFDRDYAYGKDYIPTRVLPADQQASFMGFGREDGEVGTRNYIGERSALS